ncbi:MAG TPA: hypothetical protein GX747_04015 [Tenericutes bacterium]|nr:hypothetical protein [Mycoplasmatota bacterium]
MSYSKKEINKVIKKIIDSFYLPNENPAFNQDIESFKHNGDFFNSEKLHSNIEPRTITLIGTEKLVKYKNSFRELYNVMDIRTDYKISFETFKNETQQLFFDNEFNYEKIKELLKSMPIIPFYHVARIFGVDMREDYLEFGKFAFINKNHIVEYIELKTQGKEKYAELKKWALEGIANEVKSGKTFIYLAIKYEAKDAAYCKEEYDRELNLVINTLRYISGVKNDRIYIDKKEFMNQGITYQQFTEDGLVLGGKKRDIKDIPILISEALFYNEKNGSKKIWGILSKEKNTEFEKRIIKAIDWVGISINEDNKDIACTEIAIAFEALLKRNDQTLISPSIQGQISESIALLIGKDLAERKNIIKWFKKFYEYRSSIVHGYSKEIEANYYDCLYIFKDTLTKILVDEKYSNIKTLDELNSKLTDLKYDF